MNSQLPDIHAVTAAEARIEPHVVHTPVLACSRGSVSALLKMENRQRTGSFKFRGALNALTLWDLSASDRFITASAGNHGLGAAAAAALRGAVAEVWVYEGASRTKIDKIRAAGGTIVEKGKDYDESEQLAMQAARERNLPFLHAFDDPAVIAGQGTVAAELCRQSENFDALLIPVGGGGLAAGCALAMQTLRPGLPVYGVQPAESAPMVRSMEAGTIVETPIGTTACDALAGRFVGPNTLTLCQRYLAGAVTVTEAAVAEAMRMLLHVTGDHVEPSAAVGLSAIIEGAVPTFDNPAVLVSGGNISLEDFNRIAEGGHTHA